jgi:two-component system, cell cycle sensor histidine kinase and response regulator CckA
MTMTSGNYHHAPAGIDPAADRDHRVAVLAALDLPAAIVTAQGAIGHANAAWSKLVQAGFSAGAENVNFVELLSATAEKNRERAYATLAEAVLAVIAGTRDAAKVDLRVQISGERRWFHAVVKPCAGDCLVTIDDQTATRASYSSMVEVTRVLRTVLDNMPNRTFWLDKYGCIEGANQSFLDDTGLAGVVGKTVSELDWQGALAEFFREALPRVAADGTKLRNVIEISATAATATHWIDASVEPLVSGDGTVLGFVCAYTDVSDVKAQEKLLHLTQSSINQADQALFWLRTDGTIAYCNEAAVALCGYADAELRKADLFRLQDRIIPAQWRNRWAAEGALAWTLELDLILKSGTRIPVEFICNAIEHDGDRYVSVYVRDLRERRAAAEASRLSELRHRLIIDSSLDAVIATDMSGRILEWSVQAERIFGLDAEHAIGEQIVSLIFPDTLDAVRVDAVSRLRGPSATGGKSRFEVNVVRSDGTELPAEISISSFVDGDVAIQTIFVRDLSEQAALKRSVKIAEERLSMTLESAGVGTYDWDIAAGRLSNDERCATMLFYAPGDIDGTAASWLKLIHPDDLKSGTDAVEAHFKGKTDRYFYQKRMRAKDRSWRWLHETGRVVERDASGKPLRALGVVVDVTDMKRAQEDLRLAARRLSLAKDTARIGIWEFDYQTRVAAWDDRMFELYGATRHSLNPLEWDQLVHPEDRARVVHEIQTHEAENRPFAADYRVVKRDGTIAHMQARGYLEFGHNGKPVRELGIVQDVTDLKSASDQVLLIKQQLETFVADAPVAVAMVDREGVYIAHSRRYLRDFALGSESRVGFKNKNLAEETSWLQVHRRCCNGEILRGEEDPIEVAGDTRWFRWEARPWFDHHGEIGGTLIALEDITQSRQTRRELEIATKRFRDFAATASDWLWECDASLAITFVSEEFLVATGLSPDQILGKRLDEIELSDAHRMQAARDEMPWLQHEEFNDIHLQLESVSGAKFYMRTNGRPQYDNDGNFTGYLGTAKDVTQAVRHRRASEQAEKLQAVGTLAAGVAHEFNNILSIIAGFTDMARSALRRGDATPDQLDPVIEAAARGAKLTKGMLAFSRKSPARESSTFDLRDLAEEQKLFLRPLVGPAYELKVVTGERAAILDADREGVAQCLMNFVANARDATPEGGEVLIEVDVVGADKVTSRLGAAPMSGDFVRLSVTDRGAGMDAQTQHRIFEPFFTTKDVGKGTGLGLAYVYGFIKEANGHLDLHSELGRGTTFTLFFPLSGAVAAGAANALGSMSTFTGKTALLIDDEPGLVQIYKAMLEELGFNVLAACDTDECLGIADDHAGEIHLILSDVLMPKMQGPHFVNLAQSLHPEARAVFMTGQQQRGAHAAAVLPAGIPVLDKPFTISDLSAAIVAALDPARPALRASA